MKPFVSGPWALSLSDSGFAKNGAKVRKSWELRTSIFFFSAKKMKKGGKMLHKPPQHLLLISLLGRKRRFQDEKGGCTLPMHGLLLTY